MATRTLFVESRRDERRSTFLRTHLHLRPLKRTRSMINLLPPQQKEELLTEEKFKLNLILGILVLIFLISLILVLFSIKIYISGQLDAQKIILSQEGKKFKELESKVFQEKLNFLNQELSELTSFYQGRIDLNEILEKISNFLPSGVYLTSFSFSADTFQISLAGFSPTREALVIFKKNLEQEKIFSQVSFSSNSWFEPTKFSVNFKISK